jgi:hypothetical protein
MVFDSDEYRALEYPQRSFENNSVISVIITPALGSVSRLT